MSTEKDKKVAPAAGATLKHTITQEEFDANPELAAAGHKVGDTIDLFTQNTTVVAEPNDKIEVTVKENNKKVTKTVKVKFGGRIPDMGTYTKEELLSNAEAVAYLVEIGSGCVEVVEPEKAK